MLPNRPLHLILTYTTGLPCCSLSSRRPLDDPSRATLPSTLLCSWMGRVNVRAWSCYTLYSFIAQNTAIRVSYVYMLAWLVHILEVIFLVYILLFQRNTCSLVLLFFYM